MKNLFIFFCLSFVFSMMITSCGGGSDCTSTYLSEEIQDEVNDFTQAANEWALDPQNSDKCNAYKDAGNDYLDALRDLKDCYFELGQEAEYNASINNAQASLNALEC